MRRVALVTGASRGLGEVLASFLAGQGYALVVTSRHARDLDAAAARYAALGADARAVAGDVSDASHRRRLVAAAEDFGRLDLLVNNASELGPMRPLAEVSPKEFARVLDVNLVAPLALVNEALPLLEAARGLVVNVSSDAAVGGYPSWGAYGASKAALDLASKTLHAELAPRGVSVVAVDPGDLRTRMAADAFSPEDLAARPLPEVTLPFWAWLLGQDPRAVSGGRYLAQGETWEAPR